MHRRYMLHHTNILVSALKTLLKTLQNNITLIDTTLNFANAERNYSNCAPGVTQNSQTSQDYIFHILQYFTILHRFTQFGMLFQAVLVKFSKRKVYRIKKLVHNFILNFRNLLEHLHRQLHQVCSRQTII